MTKRLADHRDLDALINLLKLRAGEQMYSQEPSIDSQFNNDENDSDDELGDADSLAPNLISSTGLDRLKYKFLDRLAELISRKKGGKFVRCSVLHEGENKFNVLISSNNDFNHIDSELFQRFVQQWREAASDVQSRRSCGGTLIDHLNISSLTITDMEAPSSKYSNDLWNSITEISKDRVLNNYFVDLKSSMLKLPLASLLDLTTFDDATTKFSEDLYHTFVPGAESGPLAALSPASVDALVARTYEVRQRLGSQNEVRKCLTKHPPFAKFWRALCFLGRPRAAFLNFIQIIRHLPDARYLKIIQVPPHWAQSCSSSVVPLNLEEALKMLPDQGKAYYTDMKIRKRWSVTRLNKEYEKICKHRRYLHAEIQMVLYHLEEGILEEAFTYIGGSKYCCYLCWIFLRKFGVFRTRGCHDHLYHKWLVPGYETMTAQMDYAVSNTLEALKQKLISDISSLTNCSGDVRQESSAGMTTFVQDSAPTSNARESCVQYSSDVADMQTRREINFPDYPIG